jgi:paraquat-inducible protein B
MAKRTNPKLIGGFVIGAIALTLAGVLAFGGGQFLKPKLKAILYFQGSLAGLDVGSPVTFRGVRVGSVTAAAITYNITRQQLRIPVHMSSTRTSSRLLAASARKKTLRR